MVGTNTSYILMIVYSVHGRVVVDILWSQSCVCMHIRTYAYCTLLHWVLSTQKSSLQPRETYYVYTYCTHNVVHCYTFPICIGNTCNIAACLAVQDLLNWACKCMLHTEFKISFLNLSDTTTLKEQSGQLLHESKTSLLTAQMNAWFIMF